MNWHQKPSLDLSSETLLHGTLWCPCGANTVIAAPPGIVQCSGCGAKFRISPLWYLDEEK